MAYDEKCYEQAEAFLEDSSVPPRADDASALAQLIQDTIEDFIRIKEAAVSQH